MVNYEELKRNTCAGIVLYNPDLEKLKKNIDALKDQTDHILCIDNASENLAGIDSIAGSYSNVYLIHNKENKGIAYALNQILHYADKKGYLWYLTMDQDSCCSGTLMREYAKYMPEDDDLAVLCPYILNNSKVTLEEYREMTLPVIQEISEPIDCITSGSLNRVSAARNMKGYKTSLFIDCVDVDYNLRLMLLHKKIYRVNTTYMLQEMGEAKEVRPIQQLYELTGKNVFRRLRYTPVYSDFRLYYIARNSSYIYRKYGKLAGKRMTPSWMRGQYAYYCLTYPAERSRLKMLKAIVKGKRDSRRLR